MRILVTGGLGFIGSSYCERLLEKGHHVLSIDNLDPFYDPNIKLKNLKHLETYVRFTSKILDISDSETMSKTLCDWGPDLVMHAAGKAGVRPSLKNPESYVTSNIMGTTTLLEAMNKSGVKKLVFCSSSSVYGRRDEEMFSEDLNFDKSISFYATSKQCGELITRMYHNLYDFSVVNLRFFTVYGPRQRPDLAIHKFLKAAIQGTPITLFGDGSMKRDYTFIDDILDGIMGATQLLMSEEPPIYETLNLGNSSPVSLKQLVDTIEKVTHQRLDIRYAPVPKGDVPITYADIKHSQERLGYSPKVGLEAGIASFYRWMLRENLYKPAENPIHLFG